MFVVETQLNYCIRWKETIFFHAVCSTTVVEIQNSVSRFEIRRALIAYAESWNSPSNNLLSQVLSFIKITMDGESVLCKANNLGRFSKNVAGR